jgi:hypothetical protein
MKRSTAGFAFFVIIAATAFISVFSSIASSPNSEFEAESFFRTYPGLVVAMASGFFGATFSMLLQCRKRASEGTLEDLSIASSWTTLTVRGSVGLGAAAILYFFFRSGLLGGNLWPDLGKLDFDPFGSTAVALVPNQHWCLLIIWCFIAGFSETFVPNILTQTETRLSSPKGNHP